MTADSMPAAAGTGHQVTAITVSVFTLRILPHASHSLLFPFFAFRLSVLTCCSSPHNRMALCCNMAVELNTFFKRDDKWIRHFDENTCVGMLVDQLAGGKTGTAGWERQKKSTF